MIQGFRCFRRFGPGSFCTKAYFEPHYGELAILRGLSDGSIVNGELVVSHYNNSRGKVNTDGKEKLGCSGFINRNRALSGDRVYAKIVADSVVEVAEADSIDSDIPLTLNSISSLANEASDNAKSCRVVGIESRRDQRFVARARTNDELVQPRDSRFPAMKIEPVLPSSALVLVKLKDWEETQVYPRCSLIRSLGDEGSFGAEDDAALEMSGLISERYSSKIDSELRTLFPEAAVIAKELLVRPDCRSNLRVFTIDPPDAKDLDDAISVSRVPNSSHLSIGVHVADVSFYLASGSPTDLLARQRATSVYLPRQVYPMLPPYLSEHLCSLLPNQDRLAFSVFFTLDEISGEFVDEPKFLRTVIRSCVKLSYDDVDQGNVSDPHIAEDIAILNKVCAVLKKKRLESGAVCFHDRTEMQFEFLNNFPIQRPTSTNASASHSLIEELMVLTNKLVAHKLANNAHLTVPVLRRHLDSEKTVLEKGSIFLSQSLGLDTQFESVSDLLAFAHKQLSPPLFSAFTHTVLSEFNQAEYFLTDGAAPHWGVGAERYMHFTSPIRRYADVIVHRKLVRIFGLSATTNDPDETDQIQICNVNSRLAAEAERSNKLFYFSTFVKSFGLAGFPMDAVVRDIVLQGGVKPALVLFLPLLGELRSQSMDSLGLELIDSAACVTVRPRGGQDILIKALSVVPVRAVVRNSGGVAKFHLRMDNPPAPPPS